MVYMKEHTNTIQSKIKQTGQTFIFNYGVRGWNMNEFASEAGITKRTLYKYVESKEALVEEIMLDYIRDIQSQLTHQLSTSKDLAIGLQQMIQIYPSLVIQMNAKIIHDVFKQYPSVEASVIRQRQQLSQALCMYLDDAKNQQFISDAFESADIIEALQALILFHAKHNPDQLKKKLEINLAMFLHGIMR